MARVLIADDEEGIRAFLSEALELDGHQVVCAEDGQAAWEKLKSESFAVLITDLKMPRMDGLELLRKTRTAQPEVEVVMLTAHGTVENAVQAMKEGAFDYLRKPVDSLAEIRLLVARAAERHRLRAQREVRARHESVTLSWGARAMAPVLSAVEKVAATDATVLLLGESGTGKEVTAKAIHENSARRDEPFVAVNCAALASSLLESELFGHERGAFTGAHERRRGRIELAAGGTFFLDEVGELAPDIQAKLLRVVQERRFERVGGVQTIHADVRWIAATNRDLEKMVANGTFREDLYHRLAVFPISLPPLRERPEDLAPLSAYLLRDIAASLGRPSLELSEDAAQALVRRPWPGNIRELRNALERAAIMAGTERIQAEHIVGGDGPTASGLSSATAGRSLADLERDAIRDALQRSGGNRKQAASELGIGERTLYEKLKRYGLK